MNAKDKIKKSIKGKEAYVLNLNDGMNDRIISNAKHIIAEIEASMERMKDKYEEEKAFYEEAKARWLAIKQQWDNLIEEKGEQDKIIATMKGFRRAESPVKQLNVMREVTEKEGTPAPKQISWLNEAVGVLEREGKFMKPQAIAERVINLPHIKEAFKQMKTGSNLRLQYITCIRSVVEHSTAVAAGKHKYSHMIKPVMTAYNDLIGLFEWVDETNVPKPEYMKEFMFATV